MKISLKTIWAISLCIFALSCSKDDDTMGEGDLVESTGIDASELESYPGDVGILIQTRGLAQKGYTPISVVIDVDADGGDYDTTLQVDQFTHIAGYNISLEDLGVSEKDELTDGVPMNITVRNQNGAVIFEQSFSAVSFRESGENVNLNLQSVPYQNPTPEFKPDMPHFIQMVDVGGSYSSNVATKRIQDGNVGALLREQTSSFDDNLEHQQYYIVPFPGEEGVFVIYVRETGRYLLSDANNRILRQSGSISYPSGLDGSLFSAYKFRIAREPNGFFTIRNYVNGNAYKRFPTGADVVWISDGSGTEVQYFNFIALNVDWEITELDTKHLQPILPAAETDFGFNSTLINCGSGGLSQEVGIEESITTSQTVGWESSISIASRNTFGASVTVGVEAEASFFGNGGSVSAEATASYEYSREVTESQSQFGEATSEKTRNYFSTRQVEVPPGKASLVYDAYQTFSNVRVPFVKRFRVKANEIDPSQGNIIIGPLSGDTIASQFNMMQFNGVIEEVASDFIVITVRGNSYLDNMVDTRSEVRAVPANCDG